MEGTYQRVARPGTVISTKGFPPVPGLTWPPLLNFANFYSENWSLNFNVAWEIDFWGRFRRAITAADASLDATIAGYDGVLVTLLGDVATNYVQVRTLQQRIALLQSNAKLQQVVVDTARRRYEAGARNELDVAQADSILAQTESQIPQSQIALRQACTRLCILMGVPPADLEKQLGEGPIPGRAPGSRGRDPRPAPPPPARRPPRSARRGAVGADRDRPSGTLPGDRVQRHPGLAGQLLPEVLLSHAFNANCGPAVQWNLLNYGRIVNNVRMQSADFQALVASYQNTVLSANAEVEEAIIAFLRALRGGQTPRPERDQRQKAESIVAKQYKEGQVDFNRLTLIQENLVQQQNLQTQAHGEIAQSLIQVYPALGGGWEVSFEQSPGEEAPVVPPEVEVISRPPADR